MTRGVVAVVAAVCVASVPVAAESLPSSGTFTGYYRVDRFGNHTFAGFTIDPKAREALKDYQDKFVTAELEAIAQPMNPGPGFVTKVGKVTPVKDAPIEITIAWPDDKSGTPLYRRLRPGEDFAFTVTVTNKMDKPFGPATVKGNGFYFLGLGASVSIAPGDVQLDPATDFRKPSDSNVEWQQKRFLLDVGRSRTWTVSVKNAPAGEGEVAVHFLANWEPGFFWVQSNCLRLDVVDEKPKPAGGLELVLEPDANPSRPPRPIPTKLRFTNTAARPLNFYLPYRKDVFAADQVVRCFDPSGTMILGRREPQSADEVFGRRDIDQKPQRLEAGKSLTLDVTLPDRTALVNAQFQGTFILDKALRKPGELYLDTAGPAVSGYHIIRR